DPGRPGRRRGVMHVSARTATPTNSAAPPTPDTNHSPAPRLPRRGSGAAADRQAPGRPTGRGAHTVMLTELVELPAGSFAMGSTDFYPDEAPVRTVSVSGFAID